LPVVVTMSTFQDIELELTGTAPPPWLKKLAAERISFMASKGDMEMSPPSPESSAPSPARC
jgi:hypothetical protein